MGQEEQEEEGGRQPEDIISTNDSGSKRIRALSFTSNTVVMAPPPPSSPSKTMPPLALSEPPVDVDALVEQVLREDVEEFVLRSSSKSPPDVSVEDGLEDVGDAEPSLGQLPSEPPGLTSEEELGDGVWLEEDKERDSDDETEEEEYVDEEDEEAFLVDTSDGSCIGEQDEGYASLSTDQEADSVLLSDAHDLLQEIMALGPNLFVSRQMQCAQSPEILLKTLGYSLPEGLLRADYLGKWNFVRRFLLRHVYERPRLADISRLEDVVRLIASCRRILVLTGAGISVSCGIPDFRSEGGLYERVQAEYALPEPECMFDIEYFCIDPEPFFSFAKELLPSQAFQPSLSHHFIRTLEGRGKLLRQFTQNIDTLEVTAGIERVVFCHGSFATATCLQCQAKYSFEQFKALLGEGGIPMCEVGGDCEGIVKPDIVFFGEALPKEFDDCLATDCHEADLVLVIGSSLKVHPVSSIPDLIPPHIPQILINRESLDHNFDIELLGNCDVILAELMRQLDWQFADEQARIRFAPRLTETLPEPPLFIEPNYHIFPGAKVSATANQPPRISSDSPISSEGLVGETLTDGGEASLDLPLEYGDRPPSVDRC